MNSTTPALIRTKGLGKAFGRTLVLQGIDLRVDAGDFLGLVGPNGAGKSTLLRILVGLHRRTGGDAEVFGIDPDADALAIRRRTSYLPGETSVYLQMRGHEFLTFAQSFHGRCDPARQRRLEDLFSLPLNARVRSYSAGMKQKLAILAALSVDVDLYVLDEPDRALDATMRAELRLVLRDLQKQGRTVLLSSHHLEELQELATRLVFLRNGALIPAGEVVAAQQQLARRFRLRLLRELTLPDGARLLAHEPDGTLVLETATAPLQFLQRLPADAVAAAEIGRTRLEDLYQLLFLPHLDTATSTTTAP